MLSAMLPAALAFLMAVVGMRLTFDGLALAFRKPGALAAGLAVQMIALPALALGISGVLRLDAVMTTGLLVVAVAPGGITSSYVALLARANVALSTAMTLVTSLAAGVSIPLVLRASGVELGEGPPAAAMARASLAMFAVAALPLAAGIALRRRWPATIGRLDRFLDVSSRLTFAAIVLATFWQNREAMLAHVHDVGPAAAALNIAAIGLAFLVAYVLRLERASAFAIAVETGLQNVAMALFVATSLLGRGDLTTPALVYAVVMNVSALALIAAARWRHGRAFRKPLQLRSLPADSGAPRE